MATNKMNQIVNNTNMEIYKAKARTIFNEASKALANNELTIEDLLKLDLEFDKAVMGVVKCEKEKARLNNEEVQNKRLLDLVRDIVYGNNNTDEDDEPCDDDWDDDEEDWSTNNPPMDISTIFGMFGF